MKKVRNLQIKIKIILFIFFAFVNNISAQKKFNEKVYLDSTHGYILSIKSDSFRLVLNEGLNPCTIKGRYVKHKNKLKIKSYNECVEKIKYSPTSFKDSIVITFLYDSLTPVSWNSIIVNDSVGLSTNFDGEIFWNKKEYLHKIEIKHYWKLPTYFVLNEFDRIYIFINERTVCDILRLKNNEFIFSSNNKVHFTFEGDEESIMLQEYRR
jgi:hypothetical protein